MKISRASQQHATLVRFQPRVGPNRACRANQRHLAFRSTSGIRYGASRFVRFYRRPSSSLNLPRHQFTTVLRTFFLSVLTHPRVQRKAQVELDRVVGSNRLPTMADRPHLPYIEAIYREIMRWNPPLPLALPHETNEEDVVQDGEGREWVVPKGEARTKSSCLSFRNSANFFYRRILRYDEFVVGLPRPHSGSSLLLLTLL